MNIIAKMSGITTGNGVMRQYRNATIRRNYAAVTSVLEFGLAMSNAKAKNGFGTFLLGGLTCLMMKLTKDQHCIMKQLKPQRDAIIARAKSIFKTKK